MKLYSTAEKTGSLCYIALFPSPSDRIKSYSNFRCFLVNQQSIYYAYANHISPLER